MKTSEPKPRGLLYVTGMGMVASLGFDVATCCAAARAGISRARPLTEYTVVSPDGEDVGLICHTVPFAADGFEGETRLRHLASLALQDLDQREPWLKDATRAACYLSLPHPERTPADGSEADEQPPVDAWARAQVLWAQAVTPLGWRHAPPLRHLALSGHTGFARALEQACIDLQSGHVDVALVGGADSLIDEDLLAWMEETGRLKTPDEPAGVQPGEAAAFVVLESEAHAQARQARAHIVLRGLAFGQETNLQGAEDPPTGKALASALHSVIGGIRFKHQLPLWCLSDHTGEPYRAMDWGSAEVHIADAHKANIVGGMTYAAVFFGDTGAASGAVALCMAASAFERHYAPAPLAALVSSADSGDRAVVLCQAA